MACKRNKKHKLFGLFTRSDVDTSMALCYMLRHGARLGSITIDAKGWVSMSDTVDYLNGRPPKGRRKVTQKEIREMVACNDKQRFEILDSVVRGPLIRASHGHSISGIEADIELVSPVELPYAVHGTYWTAWAKIKHEGLRIMNRNHIHLTTGPPDDQAVVSGMRPSCQVLVWVDLLKAEAAGVLFYRSSNGVILSPGANGVISPSLFHCVEDRWTGEPVTFAVAKRKRQRSPPAKPPLRVPLPPAPPRPNAPPAPPRPKARPILRFPLPPVPLWVFLTRMRKDGLFMTEEMANGIYENLGANSVADLTDAVVEDLVGIGFKPIPARKLLRLAKEMNSGGYIQDIAE